jgi:hypothetical protein
MKSLVSTLTAGALTYGQCVAGIRATIAAYARAVDDRRGQDIVATFCADGSLRLPGRDEVQGHAALLDRFSASPLVTACHVIVNLHVTEWTANSALAVCDLAVVGRPDETGWSVESIGRYTDLLHLGESGWRFHRRTLEYVA